RPIPLGQLGQRPAAGSRHTAGERIMGVRETLEATIAADFDEVGNHMAYADWLIEQDDPRGEFIQVQLALEDTALSPPQRKQLQDREKPFHRGPGREGLGHLADYLLQVKEVQVDRARLAWSQLFGESFEQAEETEPEASEDDLGLLNRRGYLYRFTRGWLTT